MSASPVDWSSLRDAYGSAAEVPGFLRALRSPAADQRDDALEELWSRLCHQGTVYSASATAVPSILAAARATSTAASARAQLLMLIVYIGRGYDGTWDGYTDRTAVEGARDAVGAVVPEIVDWAASDRTPAVLATVIALAAYFPAALEALKDEVAVIPPAEARLAAARALALLAGDSNSSVTVEDISTSAAADATVLDFVEQTAPHDCAAILARSVILELAFAAAIPDDE